VPVRYGYRRFGEGDDFDDLDAEELLALLADGLLALLERRLRVS